MKRAKDRNRTEEIEKIILSYLEQNPEAQDTVEGIIRFWLQLENAKIILGQVTSALDKMWEKGILQIMQSADGRRYYKLKKDQP